MLGRTDPIASALARLAALEVAIRELGAALEIRSSGNTHRRPRLGWTVATCRGE